MTRAIIGHLSIFLTEEPRLPRNVQTSPRTPCLCLSSPNGTEHGLTRVPRHTQPNRLRNTIKRPGNYFFSKKKISRDNERASMHGCVTNSPPRALFIYILVIMHVPRFETNSISTLRRYIIYSMVIRVSPSGQIKNIYVNT